jgi:hypothetical protein
LLRDSPAAAGEGGSIRGYSLAIGYWLLAIGYWLLAIGYWLLAIGYWLSAIGYSLAPFVICHLSFMKGTFDPSAPPKDPP